MEKKKRGREYLVYELSMVFNLVSNFSFCYCVFFSLVLSLASLSFLSLVLLVHINIYIYLSYETIKQVTRNNKMSKELNIVWDL